MSNYLRVIPRDLFNEAKLLKCLGNMYIQSERYSKLIKMSHDNDAFIILQNPSDGSIYCENVQISVNNEIKHFYTPLNSREAYPLFVELDEESIFVFDDSGNFSPEFLALLQ